MEAEEKARMERLENHNKFLKEKLNDVDEKVDKIYIAVVGNRDMGTIGLVERLKKIEDESENLKEEIITNRVYNKILIFVSSIIITLIIGYLFKIKVL